LQNDWVPLPKNLIGKITGEPPPSPEPAPIVPQVFDGHGVRCKVCAHPAREEIERRYVTMNPRGITRWVADNGYPTLSVAVLEKHFRDCVVGELLLSKGAQQSAENFRARVEKLVSRCEGYLDEFDEQEPSDFGKDWKGLSSVLNQLRAALELYGKALGHLGPDNVINIIESPQFQAVIVPIANITARCEHCGPSVEKLLTTDGE
jgi:hypothetical protein